MTHPSNPKPTVTIYIENKPYTVQQDQNLLQACLTLNFDLPYFCWHPALHSVGACRQCAVKQFADENDTKGKIIMSCMTPVAEGLRISIDDPDAKFFRASIIEYYMLNHPHDCPVCDEGGECHLQDMTLMTGHTFRRTRFTKRTYDNQNLGPFISHEMNRCIQCYRCVRFYRDYAGGHDLNVFGVHDNLYYGRFKDGTLENEFAGNLIEVCPTGVFTDKTLRKNYTRKWDWQTAPSVCPLCGVGCNTIPAERYGELRRIYNRYHPEVNHFFLCDRGRFGYPFVNAASRIRSILSNDNSISHENALSSLKTIIPGNKRLVGIGSPRASMESNTLLKKLVGPENFYAGIPSIQYELISQILDIHRNSPIPPASLKDAENADAILILGEDVTQTAPRLALSLRRSVRNAPMPLATRLNIPEWNDAAVREALQDARGPFFSLTTSATHLDDIATQYLHIPPHEIARLGFYIAHSLNTSLPTIDDYPKDWQELANYIANTLRNAHQPVIVSGTSLGSLSIIHAAADITSALYLLNPNSKWIFNVPNCNNIGLSLLNPLNISELLIEPDKNEKKTYTVINLENDLAHTLDANSLSRLISNSNFFITIDHTYSQTTEMSNLVFPTATFAEDNGTYINYESRLQPFYKVFNAPPPTKESWKWLIELSKIFEKDISNISTLHDIRIAMTEEMHQYNVPSGADVPSGGQEPFREKVPGPPKASDLGPTKASDLGPTKAPVSEPPKASDLGPSKAFDAGGSHVSVLAGEKIPRQAPGWSGRTAITANVTLHEPTPPYDPDTPFSFSMEGNNRNVPPDLINRYWVPGWNSVQALNRFLNRHKKESQGRYPDIPDYKIFPLRSSANVSFFAISGRFPEAFNARDEEWYFVPLYHMFGSESLSLISPEISQVAELPYVAINKESKERLRVREDEIVLVFLEEMTLELRVKTVPSLPNGIAGLPVGPFMHIATRQKPSFGRISKKFVSKGDYSL